MDFKMDSRQDRLRAEVRTFARDNLPRLDQFVAPSSASVAAVGREQMRMWTGILSAKGWSVPRWPIEWGGPGWSGDLAAILDDALAEAGAPMTDPIGIGFVGPVLYTFGTQRQKDKYLPGIRNGEVLWCQGFSESAAGSDIQSIRTMAVKVNDTYLVNGQKQWISNAHNANMMCALVKVQSPGNRRQQGLSFLLIDMRTDGVSVAPTISLDGRHWINEVSLENVVVPEENLVGEQGQGWIYARFLLSKERAVVAGLPMLRRMLLELQTMVAERQGSHGTTGALGDPLRRTTLRLQIELAALEFLEYRLMEIGDRSEADLLAPVLKLRACEWRQKISEAMFDLIGESGLRYSASRDVTLKYRQEPTQMNAIVANYLFQRSATIAGGTSEIQRNIIASLALGS